METKKDFEFNFDFNINTEDGKTFTFTEELMRDFLNVVMSSNVEYRVVVDGEPRYYTHFDSDNKQLVLNTIVPASCADYLALPEEGVNFKRGMNRSFQPILEHDGKIYTVERLQDMRALGKEKFTEFWKEINNGTTN